MNRRQDNDLRGVIDRVQSNLKVLSDCHDLYKRVLAELLPLTGSKFGFVTFANRFGQFDREVLTLSWDDTVAGMVHGRLIIDKELERFNAIRKTKLPEIYSASALRDIPAKKLKWPFLSSMIALPIVDGNTTCAIIYLANSDAPYSTMLAKRLWPLFTNIICIRRTLLAKTKPMSSAPVVHLLKEDPLETLTNVEMTCPIGVIEINQNHKIVRLNPAAEQIFGISEGEAIGQEVTTFIPERFPNEHRMYTFCPVPNQKKMANKSKYIGMCADQRVIPIDLATVPHVINGQTHHLLMIQDNSELEKTKAEQDSQIQKFKAVADLAPVGILNTNAKWECTYANDRWCEICRMDVSEIKNKGWIDAIYSEDVSTTLNELHSAITKGSEFKQECRFRTKLGELVWCDLHARPIFNMHGNVDGLIATLSDITYRHITEEKLRNMAEFDNLTGLANRVLFEDRLKQALTRVDRHGALALLCLDLDGFKSVNDSLGHDAGDALLVDVASRLKNCVRNEDTVARVGGDEFLILIESIDNANNAADVCKKIQSRFENPLLVHSQEVFISASIGISFCIDSDSIDSQRLMKQADIALYRAKSEGRNNYQYYSPELEQISQERLSMTNHLHRALKRQEFELYYQLQSDIHSERITGAEALIRWHHPEKGMLSPDEFVPLLEENGLILPIGNWLIEEAFTTFRRWLDEGLIDSDAHMSVNLSPKQLRDSKIISVFESAMRKTGLCGRQIIAEITESALLEESLATKDILEDLKQMGISIALDDFGTGYSSLTYLKRFPINYIKIDRSFVKDILTDVEDSAITQAVITLAKSLNLHAIAEGVDSKEKLEKLAEWGCDFYQGYYLNKPSSGDDVENYMRKNNQHYDIGDVSSI